MNKLYEALEICLTEIEHGMDMDSVLSRYPDLADELRPLLEASILAGKLAASAPSQDIVRRNRAKLLQRAAEMREGKIMSPSRRAWSVPLRRALVTLMVIAMLFVSGTNLVRAASTTLPGDGLYPVKRTWEDVLLFFTFNMKQRDALELEYENERLDELHELFAEGRPAEVVFVGYVSRQNENEWRVSGVTVLISAETHLPDAAVIVGSAVRVRGDVNGNFVSAKQIELLPPGSIVPEGNDAELENEEENVNASNQDVEDGSHATIENGSEDVDNSRTPAPKLDSEIETVEGVAASIENNFIVVNGILMDIHLAEIMGTPSVGAFVKVEGYYDVYNVFIVAKIEFVKVDSNGGSGSSSNDSVENSISNDNSDNHNSNDDHGGSSGSGGSDD